MIRGLPSFAAAFAFLLGAAAAAFAAAEPPPNFIVIYADDLGYGDLGCHGSTTLATPRIDRLAREGIRFTAGYAASPFCSPSRAALLTMGPISTPASRPLPTFSARAAAASFGINASPVGPTSTATEMAMQRSPAEP